MKNVEKRWWAIGLLVALVVALLSPLASPYPDGLERVAEDQGFAGQAQDAPYEVIPDYAFPGVGDERVATILAGLAGTLIVFGLAYGLAWLVRRRARQAV